MTIKLHVIGSQRSGGTAYAHYLSEMYNVKFINEPYKMNYIRKESDFGIPEDVDGHYVCHHVTNQYVHYRGFNHDDNIILIERKDKWKQLLSWICLSLYKKYGFHNISYDYETVLVDEILLSRIFENWTLFSLFKKNIINNSNVTHCYYEDLDIKSSLYFKNKGYERIAIKNIVWVREQFEIYMRNN